MINICVLPEIAVVGCNFNNALVISITSPGREHPKINGINVHKFHFHDVTEEYFLENRNLVIRPMEKEIAECIAEIAMNNRHCSEWVIHCEAGISRSPAVAIGLARFLSMRPTMDQLIKLFPSYNPYVRKMIEEAMSNKLEGVIKGMNVKKEK